MNTTGNETLERIQREIKENLEKEEEWKKDLKKLSNGTNGIQKINYKDNNNIPRINGVVKKQTSLTENMENNTPSQNLNKFIQNVKTKGMMQRFLKSKGKLIQPTTKFNGNIQQTNPIITDFVYQPPRVTSETGTLSRNGFVPAEEKIRNEVLDFQKREVELRQERRKSQPELMALLKIDTDEDNFKDEGFREFSCSSSTSSDLKYSKSLADLCDVTEDELDTPGTHHLIKQFENLKKL